MKTDAILAPALLVPAPEQKPINEDPEVCGTGQRTIHWYKVAGGLLELYALYRVTRANV